jgi:inorganic pyrophosphatase
MRKRISHFFERYKDLDQGKWVKVTGWDNAAKARQLIDEAVQRHNANI